MLLMAFVTVTVMSCCLFAKIDSLEDKLDKIGGDFADERRQLRDLDTAYEGLKAEVREKFHETHS